MRILPLVLLIFCGSALADEYYSFYRIACDNLISSFEIRELGYWNIGEQIWPFDGNRKKAWALHVAALKKLERESNLYVFDDSGYYDGPFKTFTCGSTRAMFKSEKIARDDGFAFRGATRITIQVGNAVLASDLWLANVRTLRVYGKPETDNVAPHFLVCGKRGCSDVANSRYPLTDDGLRDLGFTMDAPF